MKTIKAIPVLIKVYIIFSISVGVFFQIIHHFFIEIEQFLTPHLGWNPESPYLNSLAFSIFLINNKREKLIDILLICYSVLLFYTIFFNLKYLDFNNINPHPNPYLSVSKDRFVWVILLPAFWIIGFGLLFLKRNINRIPQKPGNY